MKSKLRSSLLVPALLGLFILDSKIGTAHAQGTAFIYQGQLQIDGSPANGTYNLMFSAFDNSSNGIPIAVPVTNNGVVVSNGLFTGLIDFGPGVFIGAALWLEISVEPDGSNAFTTLTPRQQLEPMPYAIYAEGANAAGLSGTIPMGSLSGSYSNAVTMNNAANSFHGSFSGNGSGLSNVYQAGLVTNATIVSSNGLFDNSSLVPAPWGTSNWTYYPLDITSSNFVINGGFLSGPVQSQGPPISYFGASNFLSGGPPHQNGGFEETSSTTVTFNMSGNIFVLGMEGGDGGFAGQQTSWNAVVNGINTYCTNRNPGDGNSWYFQITFATAANRTVTLVNPFPMSGIWIPCTNALWKPQVKQPVMAVLGDSFVEQAYNAAAGANGIISQMQILRPDLNIFGLGEGGTGFVNNGSFNGSSYPTNFLGRVQDVARCNPDYVVVFGGLNDVGNLINSSTTNQLYINATNLIVQIKTNCPYASLTIIGPQSGQAPSTQTLLGGAILSNACYGEGVPYVDPQVQDGSWITGNVQTPNSGNADVFTDPVNDPHPSVPAGCIYFASQILSCVASNLGAVTPNDQRALALTNAANVVGGNGGLLTGLNASQLTTGTVPLAQIPSAVIPIYLPCPNIVMAQGGASVAAANTVYFYSFSVSWPTVVSNICFNIGTGNVGSLCGFSVYTAPSGTKIMDTGPISTAMANNYQVAMTNADAAYVLQPGNYWFAWNCSSTTPTFASLVGAATNTGYMNINGGMPYCGTFTSPASGGQNPATTGGFTATNVAAMVAAVLQ